MSQPVSERPIDPGAEFANPRSNKLPFLIGWVQRHPACTLAGGEAALLVAEITRLEEQFTFLCGNINRLYRNDKGYWLYPLEAGTVVYDAYRSDGPFSSVGAALEHVRHE
jgi:hypothetical protein